MYAAAASGDPRIAVTLCEHTKVITIGRHGSRSQIRLSDEQLRRENLQVHWILREGGCVLHAPGQLAIYVVAALDRFGWSNACFQDRFQQGLETALANLLIPTSRTRHGLRGRTGLLAVNGISVRQGVSHHGMFVNVSPSMSIYRCIDVAPSESAAGNDRETMSCLLAERQQPVRMSNVRAALITAFTDAFRCDAHHIHSGHPWLPSQGSERDALAPTG
jgi:lipoyl(octanoyl) transferase